MTRTQTMRDAHWSAANNKRLAQLNAAGNPAEAAQPYGYWLSRALYSTYHVGRVYAAWVAANAAGSVAPGVTLQDFSMTKGRLIA